MNIKRPLAPHFINRLDRYLLLHKPEAWSARTHLVLFYGFLFMALLAAIAFVIPDDPRKDSPSIYWVGFVSLISFIALVGWLIYLLRFNVFKRYGLTSPLNRLITFVLYFISIGTFVLFSYVEPIIETVRANAAYTDEEIVNDMNAMNLGICKLEYDSLNHVWDADTLLVVNKLTGAEYDREVDLYTTTTDTIELIPHPPMARIDTATLRTRLKTADSVQKLNDSIYVFYDCPGYNLLHSYSVQSNSSVKPMNEVDIYRKVIKNYTPPANRQEIGRELSLIREKYEWNKGTYSYYVDQSSTYDRIKARYILPEILESMDHIMERKHRWSAENLHVFVRIFVYTTLVLTLLLFAFRHTTTKTFFLSLLAGVILTILTTLIMAFTSHSGDVFFEWILFYFGLFFVISLTAFSMWKRNVFTGIALNLFLWLLPFIPLVVVTNYYEDKEYRSASKEYHHAYNHDLAMQHMQWAEICGLVLLLVIVGTYMHAAYRKWYAAPEH